MLPAHAVEIVTPKKYVLYGLWFGPRKPERAIIWVHGLGSSAFRRLAIVNKLTDSKTAVMTFNNRGHGTVNRIQRAVGRNLRKSLQAGSAFEKFSECVDDIQGAINFAKRQGVRRLFLAGHSTGCQKSAYWAYKRGRGVRGIALLAPISDYAASVKFFGKAKVKRAAETARAMMGSGKGSDLMTKKVWREGMWSAQRFLSLNTPESPEQAIFSYFEPRKPSKMLRRIKTPLLVVLAENDEFADRAPKTISEWFERSVHVRLKSVVIKKASHSFSGSEAAVSSAIKSWMRQG